MFLDDQFNYISASSGAVSAANSSHPAVTLNTIAPGSAITMQKNGYLYVWARNETQGWDVFFDNLSVQHKRGPVLEENHYYPFGLSMAGISDKAVKTNYAENFKRYNGIEYDSTFGVGTYEAQFRDLDPQTGRWWQIDPEADNEMESLSPYASMSDDPVFKTDPLGDVDGDCCGGFLGKIGHAVMTGVVWVNENLNPLNDAVELFTGKDYNLAGAPAVNRSDAALGLGITLLGGKMGAAALNTAEKLVVKDAIKTTEKTAANVVEKDLTKAEQRAAKLSENPR